VVGLERGPLSLVSTIEELLARKISCSDLESRDYGRRDPSRWPRSTLYPQKLAPTSSTCGGRSVGIVRSRTHATGVFIHGFWIGNWIYWTLLRLGTTFRRSLSQTEECSLPLCLAAASASLLTTSQTGNYLTPNSYSDRWLTFGTSFSFQLLTSNLNCQFSTDFQLPNTPDLPLV
jgi:hypothetical protein